MRTLLIAALALLVALPAAARGAAIATPTMGELRGSYSPHIASNGDGFLATWGSNNGQVGAAFDASGHRRSPLFGLPDRCLTIIPFGDRYLVNCADRLGQTTIRHIDAEGRELRVVGSGYHRAFAATDDRILVSLTAHNHDFRVIDAAGNTFGEVISLTPPDFMYVRAAEATSSGFLLVVHQPSIGPGLKVVHVSDAGVFTAAFAVTFAWQAILANPLTAMVRDTLMIAVTDLAGGTIFTASLHPSSGLLSTNTFTTPKFIARDLVVASGGAMLIGGAASGTVGRAWKLSPNGAPVGNLLALPSEPRILATASNGGVIYAIGPMSFPDQMTGVALDSETLSMMRPLDSMAVGPRDQYWSRVASSPFSTMAVWIEPGRVRARRIQHGRPVGDVSEVEIAASGDPRVPVLAANNEGIFLIAWHNETIVARRVGSDQQILDPERLTIAPPGGGYPSGHLALASDGRDFVAVWSQDRKLVSANISAHGIVSAPRVIGEQTIARPAPRWEERTGLSLTWAADHFEVAWAHEFWSSSANGGNGGIESTELRTLSLDRSGAPIAGTARLLARDLRDPAIAFGEGLLLVAALEKSQIKAMLVDPRGNVLARYDLGPPMPVGQSSQGPIPQRSVVTAPDVSWDGREFVVVFRHDDTMHLWRLPLYGTPRLARYEGIVVLDGSSVAPYIATGQGDLNIVTDEFRSMDRLPRGGRVMVYGAADLIAETPRRRAIGR